MTHTWDTYRASPSVERCSACGLLRRTFRVAGQVTREYIDPRAPAFARRYAGECENKVDTRHPAPLERTT